MATPPAQWTPQQWAQFTVPINYPSQHMKMFTTHRFKEDDYERLRYSKRPSVTFLGDTIELDEIKYMAQAILGDSPIACEVEDNQHSNTATIHLVFANYTIKIPLGFVFKCLGRDFHEMLVGFLQDYRNKRDTERKLEIEQVREICRLLSGE